MWLKNVIFLGTFLISLVLHPTSGQDNRLCTTPRGERGRCINIKSCEPLLNLLVVAGYDGATRQFLRNSICSYENKNAIICCPGAENGNGNVPNNNNSPFRTDSSSSRYGPLSSPVCGFTNAKFTRVVNGVPAQLGAWPWAALLGYRSKINPAKPRFLCGGALISARHVLTAAHCVYNRDDLYVVRLGELIIDDDNDGATPIDVRIDRKDIHPEYSPTKYTSDIAVLRLKVEVEFSDLVRPICLPTTQDIQRKDLRNAFPFLIGWGSVYFNGPTASHLQQLQLPIVGENQCSAAYAGKGATIDSRVLCAGFAVGGKDACQGDSGGPLMFPIGKTWYSIGVVSYGFKCALAGFPGVYSKTQAFLDFILQHLN